MANILLDYFFPITVIEPTPQASTAFLKQVCIVCKKKMGGTDGVITACTSNTEVAALTDNTEAAQLFAAGMQKVFVLINEDLDLDAILAGVEDFYTLLISSDFIDANVTGADFGTFPGVIGVSSTDDDTFLHAQSAIERRAAFHTTSGNHAKNMFYAFGKLLSNASDWLNQQYVQLPVEDDIDNLGDANSLFDDKISFCLSDEQFGNRLGLFAAGKKAIVAPYILANLSIDLQSKALQYVSGNMPSFTIKHASLIEDELTKVIQGYIDRGWLDSGSISVTLGDNENFVANATMDIPEPTALWRILGEMRQV